MAMQWTKECLPFHERLIEVEMVVAFLDRTTPPLPAKLSALSDRYTRGLTMSDAIALRPRAAG
jgi:hypothetical protein